MKSIAQLILLLFFALCSINFSFAQNKAQQYLNTFKDSLQTYGMVVLVNDNGQIDTASIGQASPGKPISVHNTFNIGSTTKMFTAVLLLDLVENGKINLDDTLNEFRFYGELKNVPDTITIRNLLNHSSGIKDYANATILNQSLRNPNNLEYTAKQNLARMDSLVFSPGSKHQYSNSNFYLITLILEEILDKSYEIILQERIIERFKMNNTKAYYSNNQESLAHPMYRGMDLNYIPKFAYNKLTKGVGNITSDVFDLNKFLQLLLVDKKFLSDKILNKMLDFKGKEKSYGLGIRRHVNDKNVVFGHSGRGLSYCAFMYHSPESNISVIVLCNDASDKYSVQIYKELFKIYDENKNNHR